ncbi:MAG: TIGR00282 family metallophosphoesterase [Deltaproteobacteria bacterium]|nr:TIGR00282 family metallophosphoesterase [Candidatus Zymogenaceae bacterium]
MFLDGARNDVVRILFFGDIVGKPGRRALKHFLPRLSDTHRADLVIANGENAAGGFGITVDTAREMFDGGVDIITSGNHIWDKREIMEYIDQTPRLLRPANYPDGVPGEGTVTVKTPGGHLISVINLIGRVFMGLFDDPFSRAGEIVSRLSKESRIIIVDFHGEETREKQALGHFLDGSVSAVIGTHTHIQTADERILGGGTAFITDAGMTGPTDSVIGVKKERAVSRFLTSMPQRFDTAKHAVEAQGVLVTIDPKTGKSTDILRFKEKYEEGKP